MDSFLCCLSPSRTVSRQVSNEGEDGNVEVASFGVGQVQPETGSQRTIGSSKYKPPSNGKKRRGPFWSWAWGSKNQDETSRAIPREAGSSNGVRKSQVLPLPASLSGGRTVSLQPHQPLIADGVGFPASNRNSLSPLVGVHPCGTYSVTNGTPHHHGRGLRLDELRHLRLPCFSPTNVPATTDMPMAILAVETLDSGATHRLQNMTSTAGHHGIDDLAMVAMASGASGSSAVPGGRRQVHVNLVPLYSNASCKAYFSMANHKEYSIVLRKLIQRDPLLTFAVQKALRNLKMSDTSPVTHVTPDPTGQKSTLHGMRLTPILWDESGSSDEKLPNWWQRNSAPASSTSQQTSGTGKPQMALMIEHNLPYDPAEVMPRLMRDYAVLSHVPAILTLIDFQGKVLYQNAASLDYMGDLLSIKYDSRLSDGLLRVLFMYDFLKLDDPDSGLLPAVLQGSEWQGVVEVPKSVKQYLTEASNHAAAIAAESRGGPPSSRGSRPTGNNQAPGHYDIGMSFTAGTPRLEGDIEVDFQIGNSFTTRGMAARRKVHQGGAGGFLMGRTERPPLPPGINNGAEQGRNAPTHSQQSIGTANSSQHGPIILGVGREASCTSQYGLQPHTIGSDALTQQQRKFMTLLDKAAKPRNSGMRGATDPMYLHGPQLLPGVCVDRTSGSTDPGIAHELGSPTQAQAPHSPGADRESGSQSAGSYRPGSGMDGHLDEAGTDQLDEENKPCFHQVHAIPLVDPVLDKQVIMLVQLDVSTRVELEDKLAELTSAQLSMLEQLFPRHIIEYMLVRGNQTNTNHNNFRELANQHENVMVLFADVVGFTAMSNELEASQVMHFLNELYETFDDLVGTYDMYKLDIVGDCYIVVAGLIKEDQDGFVCLDDQEEEQVVFNAQRIMEFAKAMLDESRQVCMPHNNQPVQLRIGIHTGKLVSGLVGSKMPKFTLFGDTMNTASRMETTCRPGCIQVSEEFKDLLPSEDWEATGGVNVKGKGKLDTFLYIPSNQEPNPLRMKSGRSHSAEMDANSTSMNRSLSRVGSYNSPSATSSPAHERSQAQNPLLTILSTILGEDDNGLMTNPGHIGGDMRSSLLAAPSGRYNLHSIRTSRRGENVRSSYDEEGDTGRCSESSRAMGMSARHSRRPSEGFSLFGRTDGGSRHRSKSRRASAGMATHTRHSPSKSVGQVLELSQIVSRADERESGAALRLPRSKSGTHGITWVDVGDDRSSRLKGDDRLSRLKSDDELSRLKSGDRSSGNTAAGQTDAGDSSRPSNNTVAGIEIDYAEAE